MLKGQDISVTYVHLPLFQAIDHSCQISVIWLYHADHTHMTQTVQVGHFTL